MLGNKSLLGETPMVPEAAMKKMLEMQKQIQEKQKKIGLVHLLGKQDRVTSVIIPGAFAAVAGYFLLNGLYKLYTGTGKQDQ